MPAVEVARGDCRAKGTSKTVAEGLECQEKIMASPVNTDDLELAVVMAQRRVLKIQTKLHRWARDDCGRRFDDLYNLVVDPDVLLVAWDRVSGNRGAGTAGIDGASATSVAAGPDGADGFLMQVRADLKARTFRPVPVRERMIPKAGGKLRRLGIPTITDRVVQASLKLVLEPIFEADFRPCSYGFRPKRRAHDAVAEIRYLATRPRCYDWVVEGDIKACFDEIDHTAMLERVRRRIGDKHVLALVKAFVKAGILTEDAEILDTTAGTPQGGILSPLLANIALSVLDDYIAELAGGPNTGKVERARRLRHGLPNFKLVRYADDWCLMIRGTCEDAVIMRENIAATLATVGLTLSPEKTLITHIDEGMDFLGWHIQRHRKRGTNRYYVYVYPSKKAVTACTRKIKTLCRQIRTGQPLDDLLRRLNVALRGWAGYFRAGVSSATFSYLSHYLWQSVWRWLRRKHPKSTWKQLRRRYCGGQWWPSGDECTLIDLEKIRTTRYRYRGSVIASPWDEPADHNQTAA